MDKYEFVSGNVIVSVAGEPGVAVLLPEIPAPLKDAKDGTPVVGPVTDAPVRASICFTIGTYPADVTVKSKPTPAFQVVFPLSGARFRPPTIV
jgi:hypothetical protein